MEFPVYRFPDVLRALRKESGLTVLQAEAATSYGNNERWESGQTKVGAPASRQQESAQALDHKT